MKALSRPGAPPSIPAHTFLEDVQAVVTGALLAALAIVLFQSAGLVPGGTVGVALLLHAWADLDLPLGLLLANAPFYALAVLGSGGAFMLRTLAAVLLTAGLTQALPEGIGLTVASPFAGAVVGGALCGLAMLVLFRHRSSLGGLNILVLVLERRFGWPPAWVQLAIDAVIVGAGGLVSGDAGRLGASLLAVATLNAVLAVNHRPGRYIAGA